MSRYTARHALLVALTFILCCLLAAMAVAPDRGEPSPVTWPSYDGDRVEVTYP